MAQRGTATLSLGVWPLLQGASSTKCQQHVSAVPDLSGSDCLVPMSHKEQASAMWNGAA